MNAQIERLIKDSAELEIYAKKLVKKGEENRAQKIEYAKSSAQN